MMEILENRAIPRDAWSSFVNRHPKGTLFQTPEMFDVYETTSNVTPIAIAVFQDGVIKGVLLAAIMMNGFFLFKRGTARSIITEGPLVEGEDDGLICVILQAYQKHLPGYVIYSEIRPVFNPGLLGEIFEKLRFVREGHYNLFMDIRLDESQLWEKMHRERRRNVTKAQKAGLQFRELFTEEEIRQAIALIIDTYHRKRVPLSYVEALGSVKQILNNHVRFFAVFLDNKMIACMVRLCYNGLFYSWFNGSDDAYFKYYPNDFLTWNIICLAHKEGYQIYDFGGGGEPGVPYGVRDYKLKFGCDMYDYGRFVCVHKPVNYKLGKLVINVLKKQ